MQVRLRDSDTGTYSTSSWSNTESNPPSFNSRYVQITAAIPKSTY